MKGVPGKATVPNLNYDNLVSEDTPELSQLSNTVKKKKKKIYIYIYTHTHTLARAHTHISVDRYMYTGIYVSCRGKVTVIKYLGFNTPLIFKNYLFGCTES